MATINGTSGKDTLQGSTGSDLIFGLDDNDVLWGYEGNDWLNGGLGADIMFGGGGDDTYFVDNTLDKTVDSLGNGGDDWVFASVSHTLAANIEHLILTGSANLNGVGNALDNSLTGNAGNNTLKGLGGADLMKGGLGNDFYVVENQADEVIESADAGQDSVASVVSYVLPVNVEILYLGGTADLNGTGNESPNVLNGNQGANSLNGGMGVDTMKGGKGDDYYIVDDSDDVVIEKSSEGSDSVASWVDYTLGNYIEKLTLLGSFAVEGTGNKSDNVITGNMLDNGLFGDEGNDLLIGGAGNDSLWGGTGINTLIGESGDDTYIISDYDDTVIEEAAGGNDTIAASVSWTLDVNFENLTLERTGSIDGTGNDVDNILEGNWGANDLYGLAGNDTLKGVFGNDSLYGGLGDDNYVISMPLFSQQAGAHDIAFENPNEGTDTVQSWTDYALGENLENLFLLGNSNLNGTGNAANNTIHGNVGKNILDGNGGADILLGGAAADQFIFSTAPGLGETDTVADFAPGQDSLQLKQTIFSELGNIGKFTAGDERFFIGANAHDASDRIIYDADSGALYFDADGNGQGVAVQIAILTGQPGLAATDIWAV